jgi:hypothetical protein
LATIPAWILVEQAKPESKESSGARKGEMMSTKLTKIWLDEFNGRKDLRADFSNDRHYSVKIAAPHNPEQVAMALINLADIIALDPHLNPSPGD